MKFNLNGFERTDSKLTQFHNGNALYIIFDVWLFSSHRLACQNRIFIRKHYIDTAVRIPNATIECQTKHKTKSCKNCQIGLRKQRISERNGKQNPQNAIIVETKIACDACIINNHHSAMPCSTYAWPLRHSLKFDFWNTNPQ